MYQYMSTLPPRPPSCSRHWHAVVTSSTPGGAEPIPLRSITSRLLSIVSARSAASSAGRAPSLSSATADLSSSSSTCRACTSISTSSAFAVSSAARSRSAPSMGKSFAHWSALCSTRAFLVVISSSRVRTWREVGRQTER